MVNSQGWPKWPTPIVRLWQRKFHLHNFMQWPLRVSLEEFQPCHLLLSISTSWNDDGRFWDPFKRASFTHPNPVPNEQHCYNLLASSGFSLAPVEPSCITFCVLTLEELTLPKLLCRSKKLVLHFEPRLSPLKWICIFTRVPSVGIRTTWPDLSQQWPLPHSTYFLSCLFSHYCDIILRQYQLKRGMVGLALGRQR